MRYVSTDWSKSVEFERSVFNNQCLVNDPRLSVLGNRIRELRSNLGLSQEEFAELGQFHRTFVGSIERGETNVSFSTLSRIADALNVQIVDLFDGRNATPQASESVDRTRLRKEIAVLERSLAALRRIAGDGAE